MGNEGSLSTLFYRPMFCFFTRSMLYSYNLPSLQSKVLIRLVVQDIYLCVLLIAVAGLELVQRKEIKDPWEGGAFRVDARA